MATLDAMHLGLPPSEQLSGALGESSGVATFISKVWKIVEKPEYNSLISWSDVRLEWSSCVLVAGIATVGMQDSVSLIRAP